MATEAPPPDEVKVVIATSLADDAIQSIIDDAVLIVEGCVSTYTAARQKAIVKWVTAHMIAMTGGGGEKGIRTSKKIGDASETYARGQLGESLKGSTYGQQAIALDTTGCLQRIGRRPVVVYVA